MSQKVEALPAHALAVNELATHIHYTRRGTRYLLRSLQVPLLKYRNRLYLDLSLSHPFITSYKLQRQQDHLQLFYTINDLINLTHLSRPTVLKYLRHIRLPIAQKHHFKILLVHFIKLQHRFETIQSSFAP